MSKESELQAYRNAILAERYRALRDAGGEDDIQAGRWTIGDDGEYFLEPLSGKYLDDALDEVIRLRNQEAGTPHVMRELSPLATEPLYTADQLHAAVDEALERAAQLCAVNPNAETLELAAEIRAMKEKSE